MEKQTGQFRDSEYMKWISDPEGNLLALWVSGEYEPDRTVFLTPGTFLQQLGFIYRKEGETIDSHVHISLHRKLEGTSECLLLKKGRVSVDFFSDRRVFVSNLIMEQGDMLLLVGGGHGFTFLEEGFFVEIKQGPYLGIEEKERFDPRGG